MVFLLYTPTKSCSRWNIDLPTIQSQLGNLSTTIGGVIVDECEYEGRTIWVATSAAAACNRFDPINSTPTMIIHCEEWEFDRTYFDRTIYAKWTVCRHEFLFKNIMSIITICGTLGLVRMSLVQDWIGRKTTFLISVALSIAGSAFALLSPNLIVWIVLRAIGATRNPTTYSLFFIWAEELVGPRKRTLVTFMMAASYSLATMSVGLVAWACRTWIQLGLATSLPFVALFSYYFLVDESPRWLLSVGQLRRATVIIEKMAKTNGKSDSELKAIREQIKRIDWQR